MGLSINSLDEHKKNVILKNIEKTLDNLAKNNMSACFVTGRDEAYKKVSSMLNIGDSISYGGSMTLSECGIFTLIHDEKYRLNDHDNAKNPQERDEIIRRGYSADVYLTSSNAVTIDGCLYNVDGLSNRVSAILYGPAKVIVVVGYNKLVRNVDEAIARVKTMAAPANCNRLGRETYCSHVGECAGLKDGNQCITAGCKSSDRICCNYVVSGYQRIKDRIHVIIVGESLGY